MKETIQYVGYWHSGDQKSYIEKVIEDKGSDFKGIIVKFGYLNKYTGLRDSKKKGWFRINNSRILYPKSGVIWNSGSVVLNIEKEIKEDNMKSLKRIVKEEIAIKRLAEQQPEETDVDTVAEYFVDEVGNLNDTLAIKDFFIKNGITDIKVREEILKLAKKKLSGK